MTASLAHISFYDKAKDSLSSAFNHVKNDLRQAVSKVASAASSRAASTAGETRAHTFEYKTHEQWVSQVMRQIKEGKLALAKDVSPHDIKQALNSGKYAGMDAAEMIKGLEESNLLKQSQPKPKPEELKLAKRALSLPAPGMAA